jgi:hypothetical protein
LVRFLVVESVHPDLSPRLDTGAYIFLVLSRIYQRYAFSSRRRSRRQRGAYGDFVNLENCQLSPLKVLIVNVFLNAKR